MAEKKPDPNAIPPNKNTLIFAVVLIVVGTAWSLYEFNPGQMLRQSTEAEIKEIKEDAIRAAERAKEAAGNKK